MQRLPVFPGPDGWSVPPKIWGCNYIAPLLYLDSDSPCLSIFLPLLMAFWLTKLTRVWNLSKVQYEERRVNLGTMHGMPNGNGYHEARAFEGEAARANGQAA